MTYAIEKKTKQPREVLDFDFEAKRRLDDDDVIDSVTASVAGSDVKLTIQATTWTDTRAKVWLAGGTDQGQYKITALIVTIGGRTIEGEFLLFVKER